MLICWVACLPRDLVESWGFKVYWTCGIEYFLVIWKSKYLMLLIEAVMKQIVFPVAVGFLYNFFNFLRWCLNEAFLTVNWFVKIFVQTKHLKKCVASGNWGLKAYLKKSIICKLSSPSCLECSTNIIISGRIMSRKS